MAEPIITPQDIDRIAELASLDLTDAEKQRFVQQFEDILTYFKKIDEAPAGDLQDHPIDAADHMRDDVARPSGLRPDEFSSHMESGHFKVPKVIE
ncbi:MAG TPA: Asp-tRNA(Asn)/Glu-tRNA(Gln) amidotransferase subunit GatC [bacterium]|nr:Asp-tRNA(Asn)/Glu-tRNA(Gln) amidotransferase subunit GatC [bacterium]